MDHPGLSKNRRHHKKMCFLFFWHPNSFDFESWPACCVRIWFEHVFCFCRCPNFARFCRCIGVLFLSLSRYIYIYIHTYMHAYIHAYIHACMRAYIHMRLVCSCRNTLWQSNIAKENPPFVVFLSQWNSVKPMVCSPMMYLDHGVLTVKARLVPKDHHFPFLKAYIRPM